MKTNKILKERRKNVNQEIREMVDNDFNKETKIEFIRKFIANPAHRGRSFTGLESQPIFNTVKFSTRIGEEERRQGKTLVKRERIQLRTGEYVTKYTII